MKSIFDIENRLDVKKEFRKFVKIFHMTSSIKNGYIGEWVTLFKFFDIKVFKNWKYRDTMLNTTEFLEHIGVSKPIIEGHLPIDKDTFLRYIEFVLNMLLESKYQIQNCDRDEILDATIKNIDTILEKMNYKYEKIEDRVILTKRDSDVDSVLEYISKDIAECLLEYNDFRIQNDIEAKRKILKDIDLYIEKNMKGKQIDEEVKNSIGMIVNKMGVNHPITEEPYKSFTEKQLLEWYDKCFLLMIHAIRTVEVNKIKNERKQLLQK